MIEIVILMMFNCVLLLFGLIVGFNIGYNVCMDNQYYSIKNLGFTTITLSHPERENNFHQTTTTFTYIAGNDADTEMTKSRKQNKRGKNANRKTRN